jgi:hypothetical protein
MKKGKLNIELYHIRVKAANEWGKLWYHIEVLFQIMQKVYYFDYSSVNASTQKI